MLVLTAIVTLHSLLPPSASLVFAALVFLLVLLLGVLLYMWVDRPLQRVLERLTQAESGRFLHRAPEPSDEIGQLGKGYNRLLARITDLNAAFIDKDRELLWAKEKLSLQENLDRKTKQLERRLRERELLAELGRTFSSTLDVAEVLDTVCRRVAEELRIDEVAVLLKLDDSSDLEVAATYGLPDAEEIRGLRFSAGEGITGQLWESGGLVYVPDVATDERFLHWKGQHRLEVGSFVAVLMEFAGEKLGVVDFTRLKKDGFSQPLLNMLEILVQQAAISVRNARLYARTEALATHDELTGLLNRRTFLRRLETEWARRKRFGEVVSVLVIDVDRFKQYNDQYGHLVGDRILAHVAKAMYNQVRKVDLVARYGGEEFVVMLTRTESPEAQAVAEKLRSAVEQCDCTSISEKITSGPTISIGVATANPANNDVQPLDLLDCADQALLRAKATGRNRVEVGEP